MLLLSYHQFSIDILSCLSVLTLQLQDMSHLDFFFFPLCVYVSVKMLVSSAQSGTVAAVLDCGHAVD